MKYLAGALSILLIAGQVEAMEYYVGRQGNDLNNGAARDTAFLTIQKGVSVLAPGDTLTIGPGEYLEKVHRDKLGDAEKDTIIRAEIPGTVVLRGDVPVPTLRKLDGQRYVYVADFDFAGESPAVNELDTLKILSAMPNAAEPEFLPGTFHYDRALKKLYLSTSDMKPAETHRYSVSVISTHGLCLTEPRRVVIEGLGVTGFNALKELSYRERTMGGVWGIFLACGKRCVIRDCRAWLNGWGIGLNSETSASGDNVIERCSAWANNSQFGFGDMGGLSLFSARRDVIRNSTAFLNGMYGINIYGTGTDGGTYGDKNIPGNDEQNRSRLVDNLAWGNWCDFKIKTGVDYFHLAERCAGPGLWSITEGNRPHGLIGRETKGQSPDSIVLASEQKLDPAREFADPENHDYRLQATSRFRGTAPDGSDRGPFQYRENIFYVRTDGDDTADGLSVAKAWKSLGRAAKELRPGDTLYLLPGSYSETLELTGRGGDGGTVSIRGRGADAVIIRGGLLASDCRGMEFTRLNFAGDAVVANGSDIAFENCRFAAAGSGLTATGVTRLSAAHCLFTGFQQAAVGLTGCANADLRGNLYDNRSGPALRLDKVDSVRYSDYNSYRDATRAWEIGRASLPLGELQKVHDRQSRALSPELVLDRGVATLKNPELFAAAGPLGRPVGLFRENERRETLSLANGPVVHSVTATTANLEWMTSLPATCELAWGETPECKNKATFDVNYFGTYSLTGLKPGATYYWRILSLNVPPDLVDRIPAPPVKLTGAAISFTTAKANRPPATYYVAPDGDDARTGLDRQQAWKTIRHAADGVNAGDTVLIAGGTYRERVRIRATGDVGAPITFKCLPGEKAILDGADKALHTAFVAGGKEHLRFDGLYFRDFSLFPYQGWPLALCGEFSLYRCREIQITRCFSSGLNGYTAKSISAFHVADLRVSNCVNTNKMDGAMRFERCPNLRVENCVFARPMIQGFILRNDTDQKSIMENCIFTDMLQKKAALNIPMFAVDYRVEPFLQKNCCYHLRCFPPEKRPLIGETGDGRTAANLVGHVVAPLFADPEFAGVVALIKSGEKPPEFGPERLMDPNLATDFDSFFATNPDVIKRGIGLQPEAFADFKFAAPGSGAK